MIIAITGSRPTKIGGYKLPNPTYNKICREIERLLSEMKPEKCLSGMALGADQYFASVCLKLRIPLVACIPFEGQEMAWPEASQKTYRLLRKLASEEVIVSDGGYAAYKMQIRNEYLVDHCDKLIAVFNQADPSGGTFNCIKYAQSVGREIIFIDPRLD
jgi:uncharacterized phage-like protein YoqJ